MTASAEARDTALLAAQAAADKLATDISIVDVSDRLAITDAFVLASAPNERQVQAIVDEVEERLREHGIKPVRREGDAEAAGCCWTSSTSSCTSSTPRSAPSTPSSGCGRTARRSRSSTGRAAGRRPVVPAATGRCRRRRRTRPTGDATGAARPCRCRGCCSGGTAAPSGTPPAGSRASSTRRWTRWAGGRRSRRAALVAGGCGEDTVVVSSDLSRAADTATALTRLLGRAAAARRPAARARHGPLGGADPGRGGRALPRPVRRLAGRPAGPRARRRRGGPRRRARRGSAGRPARRARSRSSSPTAVRPGGCSSGCSGSDPTTAASSDRWPTALERAHRAGRALAADPAQQRRPAAGRRGTAPRVAPAAAPGGPARAAPGGGTRRTRDADAVVTPAVAGADAAACRAPGWGGGLASAGVRGRHHRFDGLPPRRPRSRATASRSCRCTSSSPAGRAAKASTSGRRTSPGRCRCADRASRRRGPRPGTSSPPIGAAGRGRRPDGVHPPLGGAVVHVGRRPAGRRQVGEHIVTVVDSRSAAMGKASRCSPRPVPPPPAPTRRPWPKPPGRPPRATRDLLRRRHPGAPAPRRADRGGGRRPRFGAGGQARPARAGRPGRAAGEGAHHGPRASTGWSSGPSRPPATARSRSPCTIWPPPNGPSGSPRELRERLPPLRELHVSELGAAIGRARRAREPSASWWRPSRGPDEDEPAGDGVRLSTRAWHGARG